VANNRSAEALTPVQSMIVVLTGSDLARQCSIDEGNRALLISDTYNGTAGSNLTLSQPAGTLNIEQCWYLIKILRLTDVFDGLYQNMKNCCPPLLKYNN
jgi:hypothetical protein